MMLKSIAIRWLPRNVRLGRNIRLRRHIRLRSAASRSGGLLFALTILVGQIVDRTTGQPLTGVDVSARGGANVAPARTNDTGEYTLHGLPPGHYTITVSSDDVPPQTFTVVVRGTKPQRFNITACSTTLDYSCASATP